MWKEIKKFCDISRCSWSKNGRCLSCLSDWVRRAAPSSALGLGQSTVGVVCVRSVEWLWLKRFDGISDLSFVRIEKPFFHSNYVRHTEKASSYFKRTRWPHMFAFRLLWQRVAGMSSRVWLFIFLWLEDVQHCVCLEVIIWDGGLWPLFPRPSNFQAQQKMLSINNNNEICPSFAKGNFSLCFPLGESLHLLQGNPQFPATRGPRCNLWKFVDGN